MKIRTRYKEKSFFEIEVECGNTTIREDLSNNGGVVPESDIEELITAANYCNRFNGGSDIDFVKKIFEAFLSDSEREEFLSLVNSQEAGIVNI